MTALVLRGDALNLPLPDSSVDLIVTSPPYWALRSYTDAGEHYAGQIGSEATPAEFIEALLAATTEMVRVLKPTGSIFVNLGDKYSDRAGPTWRGSSDRFTHRPEKPRRASSTSMAPRKSLLMLPERYRIACVDELGLIARQVLVWNKPNGLPESVTDRARRSHEDWVHLTLAEKYYAATDEIREPHTGNAHNAGRNAAVQKWESGEGVQHRTGRTDRSQFNPLGKLPGSVWTIQSEPLVVPDELGIEHFAAFPTEWPRRLILGWSPAGICTSCGEGRRPLIEKPGLARGDNNPFSRDGSRARSTLDGGAREWARRSAIPDYISGYICACPEPSSPAVPAVVLDPFGGTGTTALVASVLGRVGITLDRSHDYCRLASWRTGDPAERARAARVAKPPVQATGQLGLELDGDLTPTPPRPSGGLAYAERLGRDCSACGYRTQYAKAACDRCGAPRGQEPHTPPPAEVPA